MSYPPPAPGYGYPAPVVPPNSGKATTSLVLGVVSLVLCGLFLGIPAMIVAWQAKREIRESNGALGGDGLATAGFVTGLIGTLWSLLLAVLVAGVFLFAGPISNTFTESCTTTDDGNGNFSVECS